MKVKSGADIRHGTLGIVFSMNCQEMPPPPTQMRLVYIWVKRRRLSATEVVHGPHKSIRTNFRMGGVMALGHISRYRHAPTHPSETVEKIGSNSNEFFKAQKSNCKSPAAPQCCERLLQGYGAP